LADSAHPEGLARKRKVSPSFQALRSPSTHRYTTRERVPDSPDSPIDWGGVDNERDSSDEDSQAKPDSAREKDKGKEVLRSPTAPATYALEKQDLARERKIRADHRVTASEREVQAISASALISALQTRSGCPLFTTPTTENKPILPSRSPSTCNSSPLAGRDRRFSVDELGSPSFNPRFALEPRRPDWGYTSQLRNEPSERSASDAELRDAPTGHGTIEHSPKDIRIEDAPALSTPHRIPGSWTPPTHILFGDVHMAIPPIRQPAVDKEIALPDAPADSHRRAEEQLFYSEDAKPRISLPPTPAEQKPVSGQTPPQPRQPFTTDYPPPATYGTFFQAGPSEAGRYDTTSAGRYRHRSTQTDKEMMAKKMENLEEMMKQLMASNEKRDTILDLLLARMPVTTAPRSEDLEQAQKDALFQQLEEERIQSLAAVEAELKMKYEAAGFEYDQPPNRTQRTNRHEAPEHTYTDRDARTEHVKVSQIGFVQPLPAHAEWTGQAHAEGDNSTYVSFKAWLDHLQAVLEQKESTQWKRAVLDCASLSCLKGRALDWWHACSPAQQWSLRHDYTLDQWRTLGKPLFRNEALTRKEARDRKRQHGETLSEYAWRKLAMLNEAYGRNRPVLDVISDIKEGMLIGDQEKITADLHKSPAISRFLEEVARLDTIRGPMFKEAMTAGKARYNTATDKRRMTSQTQKKQPVWKSYDPKQLAFRKNPLGDSAAPQWSYVFPNGRTIFLSTPCTHCGAKHFNFECKKADRKPRAAAMFGEAWDETHEDSDEASDSDEMEEACSTYVCIAPSSWTYYGRPQNPEDTGQTKSEPWDEFRNKLKGN
jgi:plasmid maintenance system killer protein